MPPQVGIFGYELFNQTQLARDVPAVLSELEIVGFKGTALRSA